MTHTQNPSTYVQVSFHKRVGGANSTGSIYWRQMKFDATGKLRGQFPFHYRIPAACLFRNKCGDSETSLFWTRIPGSCKMVMMLSASCLLTPVCVLILGLSIKHPCLRQCVCLDSSLEYQTSICRNPFGFFPLCRNFFLGPIVNQSSMQQASYI